MNINPLSGTNSPYIQSLLSSSLSSANSTSGSTGGTSGVLFGNPQDSNQLSPFAQLLSTLQQLQQSNPTEYQQITQQIATNMQSAVLPSAVAVLSALCKSRSRSRPICKAPTRLPPPTATRRLPPSSTNWPRISPTLRKAGSFPTFRICLKRFRAATTIIMDTMRNPARVPAVPALLLAQPAAPRTCSQIG